MFRFLRKHHKVVMTTMAITIVLLLLFGIGGSSFTTSPFDTILKVNSTKISQADFDRVYNQVMRSQPDNVSAQKRAEIMNQALNEIIRQEVFAQEAAKYGIQVSDQQLQMQLAMAPAFQKEGRFDLSTYARVVTQVVGMRIRDFEKMQKKDIAGRELNQLIASSIQITDEELAAALPSRLAIETDAAKRKELAANPESLRNELREREANLVFNDWLSQLNSALKVNIVSDVFRQRLNPPAPAPSAPAQ